ncbi:MAG: Swt1 family HEPN domain-containing protein, partial [Clostridia bacterium]|nr:Swt1 family HEPN domain-containing protein [Clostridia bacterium]
MNNNEIVSKMNAFLHEAAKELEKWLSDILPRVTETWWDDCVIASLSYAQRELANERGFDKLSDFDLAALLRIANKSWYDLRTVAYLPTSEREVICSMIAVRNNWAHCSAMLPGKDEIISDLQTIRAFMKQLHSKDSLLEDIKSFIEYVESPDSITKTESTDVSSGNMVSENNQSREISVNSIVRLTASPKVHGVVKAITDMGF